MTEVELVEEDIHEEAGLRIAEAVPLSLGRDDQVLVDDEAQAFEPRPYVTPLVASRGEVHISQVALHLLEELDVRGAVETVGERAEDAKLESALARLLHEAQRPLDVFEMLDGH